MNLDGKKNNVALLSEKLSRANMVILTDFTGMGVEEIREVKGQLRSAEGEFQVVKNTIAVRASAGTALEGVQTHFKGPTAIVFGYLDPVGPAKALKTITDKQKKLKIKAGIFDGDVVDLESFRKIASLPSKQVLLGELVGRLNGPIAGFAGCLHGVLGQFVRTLQAVQNQREES